jgi:hypothetical protein
VFAVCRSLNLKEYKTLKYNNDGGQAFCLGNKSPGDEKEANWLARLLA